MEPEQLVNEMRTLSMLERQGEWQDLWSPIDMLNRNNFAVLSDAQMDVVGGVEDSVAAVSYTHLRAHETLSDL
eukprot:4574015-Karenia_brevis.AAC.1